MRIGAAIVTVVLTIAVPRRSVNDYAADRLLSLASKTKFVMKLGSQRSLSNWTSLDSDLMSDCRNDFLRASHALSALRANEIEGCQDGVAVTRISGNSGLNTLALSWG